MAQNKDRQPEKREMPAGHRLLADKLNEKGFAASAPEETPESSPASLADALTALTRAGKIVLRREHKGRGGKTVTIASGLNLSATELDTLARAMRKGLGCGSIVENGAIVLQGDIPERAQTWLHDHGATKIVLGN